MSEPEWYIRETIGVQAIKGPTWDNDLQTICTVASSEICQSYRELNSVPAPISQKTIDHYYQNLKTGRFQPYIEDWSITDNKTESSLYPIEFIDLPISFITGANDSECPPEQSYRLSE